MARVTKKYKKLVASLKLAKQWNHRDNVPIGGTIIDDVFVPSTANEQDSVAPEKNTIKAAPVKPIEPIEPMKPKIEENNPPPATNVGDNPKEKPPVRNAAKPSAANTNTVKQITVEDVKELERKARLQQGITDDSATSTEEKKSTDETHTFDTGNTSDLDNDDEIQDAQEVIEEKEPPTEIPNEERPVVDPWNESKVKKRNYASHGTSTATTTGNAIEQPIPEPIINPPPINIHSDVPPSNTSGDTAGGHTFEQPKDPEKPKQKVNPSVDDLSPSQRRKAAELTADMFIMGYAQIIPMVPKYFAKYDIRKMQQMEMDGKINLSFRIKELDNITIKGYMESINAEVDKRFVVTEEMQKEIKEPLVEVLLEKQIAATPIQRLGAVLGLQLFGFLASSREFNQTNKEAMKTFTRWNNESKTQPPAPQAQHTAPQPQAQQTQPTQHQQPQQEQHHHTPPPAPEEQKVTDTRSTKVEDVEIISEVKNPNHVSLSDIVETKNDVTVTVEEVIDGKE